MRAQSRLYKSIKEGHRTCVEEPLTSTKRYKIRTSLYYVWIMASQLITTDEISEIVDYLTLNRMEYWLSIIIGNRMIPGSTRMLTLLIIDWQKDT